VQIVLERIIAYHGVKYDTRYLAESGDLYPRRRGFEPYREAFKKLLGKPIAFSETYMASEGSFGFQPGPDKGIRSC
jgi:hypothetical protein